MKVGDITSASEIFIDDLLIMGGSSPLTGLLSINEFVVPTSNGGYLVSPHEGASRRDTWADWFDLDAALEHMDRAAAKIGCDFGVVCTTGPGGAFFSAELLIKIRWAGRSLVEVGVPHYPRTAGSPTGARPTVIWRAVKDCWGLRLRLWANRGRALRRGRPILGLPSERS